MNSLKPIWGSRGPFSFKHVWTEQMFKHAWTKFQEFADRTAWEHEKLENQALRNLLLMTSPWCFFLAYPSSYSNRWFGTCSNSPATYTCSNGNCKRFGGHSSKHCETVSNLNLFLANPAFDHAGSQVKFREGWGFDPLWRVDSRSRKRSC